MRGGGDASEIQGPLYLTGRGSETRGTGVWEAQSETKDSQNSDPLTPPYTDKYLPLPNPGRRRQEVYSLEKRTIRGIGPNLRDTHTDTFSVSLSLSLFGFSL